jgi:thiol-disulfide isomerase/thioredoxin
LKSCSLNLAAKGFELLADEQAVQEIENRVLVDFPKSDWTQSILGRRALAEPDNYKRADQLEGFIARYPEDGRAWLIYADLFHTRAHQSTTPGTRLATIGDAWIRHVTPTAYSMIAARVKVALVLAERQSDLGHAQAIADEAANIAKNLTVDSPLVASEPLAGRESHIARLREEAQMVVGFVHLRQGRIQEAVTELSGPLQPVSRQVERDGYILWRDADLREFGLRPRVLWLAELFEAQADYQRAAKYLLAGASDDERGNQYIQSRLPAVYAKLGRSEQEAAAAGFNQAVQRFGVLTATTAARRDEDKRRLLALRTDMPAPDFKALKLDKTEVRLADFKGKVTVLVFWATWCGPCIAEMPHFQEAVRKYAANQDVIFLAISIDERRLAVRPFIERNRYRLPVAYDINGAAAFGINGVPLLIIVDRQGRVAFREQGFGSEADRYVERLSWRIDELLNESTSRISNE